MQITLTEENYIKTIFSINSVNKLGASTNNLSALLSNKASSVSDMLKRLAVKKLINYQKYKNVSLTAKGKKIAIKIIRNHRLWEVFLTEKLNFKWDEIHDIAEQLEHIKSEELTKRLAKFLGNPKFDPHGDPIPDSKGLFLNLDSKPLNTIKELKDCYFVGVCNHGVSFLKHLTSIGLKIGDKIKIENINSFDNSYKIYIQKKESQFISNEVAANILVKIKK